MLLGYVSCAKVEMEESCSDDTTAYFRVLDEVTSIFFIYL